MSSKQDEKAIKIGESLRENTTLATLDISVEGLTPKGAEALAVGIALSKLTAVAIKGQAQQHDKVMGILFRKGLMLSKSIACLNMLTLVGDVDAFIGTLHLLRSLKLWNTAIASETVEKLRDGLARNDSLEELSLGFDGSSSSKIEQILSSLELRSHHLKKLQVRILADPELDQDSLFSSLSRINRLGKAPEVLELFNCDTSGSGWDTFCDSLSLPAVASLAISNSHLRLPSVESLSRSLAQNTSLQSLCLCKTRLGNEGLEALCSGLVQSASLNTVQLVNNEIGDDGVASFVKSWKHDSNIQHLDLSNNAIGPTGAKQLMQAAAFQSRLQSVSLAGNVNIGMDGLKAVGGCLSQVKLNKLDLSMRPAGELFGFALPSKSSKNDVEEAGQALMEGLESNFSIQKLIVSESDFPSEIQSMLRYYADLNQSGRYLLRDHAVPPGVWGALLAKCEGESPLFYFLLQKPELMTFLEEARRHEKKANIL
jgi:hypothetical protein